MLTISVCIGSACHLKGSYNVISALEESVKKNKLENQVEIKAAFCLGHCTEAVSVQINYESIQSVDMNSVDQFFLEEIVKRLRGSDDEDNGLKT